METIREFMRTHEVPTQTRRRITAYLDNFYSNKTAFDEEAILGKPARGREPGTRVLPAAMDRELKKAMYANIVKHIPFLDELEPEVVADLVDRMKPMQFAQGENITFEGEVGLEALDALRRE